MKRIAYTLFLLCVATMMLVSCQAVKKFMSQDLEDEDFIIGQLYADELVEEVPIVPPREANRANVVSTSRSGIELIEKDNAKLYAAIDAWYGTPYQYGGCSKSGIDCSCFVDEIFKTVYGIKLHRVAADIQKDVRLIGRNQLKEGDVVFFTNSNGKVSHVGIYLKEDMFVHASTSRGVMVSKLSNTYWNAHFYKGGRHKDVTTKY
ncbi:MAG: NlpC/P60 family protein [Bacteroidales bacterium]|nr:NlpC/P60 family protein [Bacteroidales bacterium]